jgi:hypothetical protein
MGHRGGFNTRRLADFPALPLATQSLDPTGFAGFSYFLGPPTQDERSTLGDNPAQARHILQALYDLLPLGSHSDNVRIPSGYTYLLQFLAHDLVNTTVPFWAAADAGVSSRNMREAGLQLETLYGGGPVVCPIGFEPAGAMVDDRTQLRIGQIGDAALLGAMSGACPFRDIARLKLDDPGPPSNVDAASQVYVADTRNDDNIIVAQILVLFSILHNAIAAKLDHLGSQRCFALTSVAMLTMYHTIIRRDVLQRLLHPAIYQRLMARDPGQPWLWQGSGIPLEFSHGAFRVGHAMVRPSYQLNANNAFPISGILGGPVIGDPVRDPLPSTWIVAWSHFFELGGTPNYSLALSLRQQSPLDFGGILNPIAANTPDQLTLRDWLSAANARMWRVDRLIDAVTPHYPDARFMDGVNIRTWLQGLIAGVDEGNAARQTLAAAMDLLTTDLPIPAYAILEAQLDPANNGQHMGPLGSVIVGEVIGRHIALQSASQAVPVSAVQQALGNDWDRIQDVGTMPDLVRLAADWGDLTDCAVLPFIM